MSMLELMMTRPFLMERDMFDAAKAVVSRGIDAGTIQALAARKGDRPPATRHTGMRDGVAVISVFGPIFRHANLVTDLCEDGVSTARLSTELQAAMDDPACRSILLEIDSPGGQADGISELAGAIRAANATKPVVAYGDGAVCSGAYWLASAASEIVVSPTARLGSIGAIMAYRDESARDERLGITTREFRSRQSPNKALSPATEEGAKAIDALLYDLASVFISEVARNRGVTEETVLSDFGQGGTFLGQRAIDAGLADRLGSFESVLKELSTGAYRRPHRSNPSAGRPAAASVSLILTPARELQKMNMAEFQAAWEAAGRPDNFDLATLSPAPKAAEPEPKPKAADEAAVLTQQLGESEVVKALQKQVAALQVTAIEAQAKETLASLNDHVLPAQRPTLLSSLIQAAADDQARPLSTGSRLENLRASVAAGPKHNLTTERMGVGGIVLEHERASADAGGAPSKDEVDRLLAMTPAGQAVLAARGK